jgi:hypothetical protein
MLKTKYRQVSFLLPITILAIISTWYAVSLTITSSAEEVQTVSTPSIIIPVETPTKIEMVGKNVLIHLDTNSLELRDGTTTEALIHIVSQGKPNSYYETIGGYYTSNYKEPLHFSSIGHVYMPFSIHVFGNYFIHGIPYYPDGTKVSSAFSGGCIRLEDVDAKHVYDFITSTTTIILTRGSEHDFDKTTTVSVATSSITMTRLMVATISLELLTQDNEIRGLNGETTTRREMLPLLLTKNNDGVSKLYAKSLDTDMFVQAMNDKALSLGLTNTHFTDVTSPVITTEEDYTHFMNYIRTYKSYLLGF